MVMVSGSAVLALFLPLFLGACEDNPPPPIDAGADAGADGASDSSVPDAAPPPPMCGNATAEAGESCDDGNDVTGDGCTPECRLEPGCGDSALVSSEVCDDGNRRDGDGCRGDCASDESCGNSIVDYAAGEVCDDGNATGGDGCGASCRIVEGCGDGEVRSAEGCDDGDTARWDGCGPDCRDDQTAVFDTLQVDPADTGCDLNYDGAADNLFGTALGHLIGIMNAQIQASVDGGVLLLFLPFFGLDDASDDDFFSTSVMAAFDADSDRANNFTGSGQFLVDPRSLSPDQLPATSLTGRLTSGRFEAGRADIRIVFIIARDFPETMVLDDLRLSGRVTGAGGRITRIDDGRLCGALTVNGMAQYGNPLLGIPGFESIVGCDGQVLTTFADVMIGGASALGLNTVRVQPDVDLDGDGLERFEAITTGPAGCQPVVSACIDGDGTRVEGPDCDLDPRFADGFSSSLSFTAVRAQLIGVAP